MDQNNYDDCINACHECVEACERCAAACLNEVDVTMMARCIELDRSCADISALAEREMMRESDFAEQICGVCAEACEACSVECKRHEATHCQECAEACDLCAAACRRMAGVAE